VGEAIARAQAVLDLLKLSKADLSPAIRLVAQAREALARREYDPAQALAVRAEALASSLEERYRGAQKALSALTGIAKKAREIGFGTSEFDAAVAEARKVARDGTVEDGLTIPNYLQARAILEAAGTPGADLLKRAQAVANEIFTAELALDALKDANGHSDHEEFERLVLTGGRGLLEGAKQALATGDLDAAETAARRAGEGAKKTLAAYQDAIAALKDGEKAITDLRASGILAAGPERLHGQGLIFLRRAKIAEAKEILERAAREAQRIAIDFRRATKEVAEAETSVTALARAGFVSEDAERAVQDAKRSLAEGRYDRAEELSADARRALGKRQEVRDRIARTIGETKRMVEELRAIGIDYANDVEEMVLRAEREFENGDFVNSSEDLKIASLLMGPRRPDQHRGRPA
jgi:cell division septum initiation protein DivIVA